MKPPSLTLRQFAALTGVSASTVSRALRNDSEVSPETCKRFQKLAAEFGYKPNPLVSTLMASRVRLRKAAEQQVLAYLTGFPVRDEWRSYSGFVDYFTGAQERAEQCGYRLEEFWLRERRMTSRRMSDILFHRGIHGILLAPLPAKMGHLSLKWERFSAVALGYSIARPLMHRAVYDHLSAIRTALRHLQKRGYRRVALVMNREQDRRSNDAWSAGFGEYSYLRRQSERVRPYFYSEDFGHELKFQRWLDRERPDSIVSGSPLVLEWMKHLGRSTPKDFGFVLLDRSLKGSTCSGIYPNGGAIGGAAIDMIIGQINRNERGLPDLPKTTMIQGQWVEGTTLRPALS